MNGGPVRSISIGGREFSVAQDSEVEVDFGGYRTEEFQMNGDGTGRAIGNVVPSKITGGSLDIDIDGGDDDFIRDLFKKKETFDAAVTLATGQVYSGLMVIVGEPTFNLKSGTMEIELQGTELKK